MSNDSVFNHLNNVIDSIVAAFVFFCVGLGLGVLAERYRSGSTNQYVRKKVKEANKKGFAYSSLLTVSGSRFELTKSQLVLRISSEAFRIPFPDSRMNTMKEVAPLFVFNEAIATRRVLRAKDAARSLIPDLEEILGKCAEKTADALIERARRKNRLFNGMLFHVLRISPSATNDAKEDPLVEVEFYETDYFTHQVVHGAFLALKERQTIKNFLERAELNESLDFFMNGFGLNCLVCVVPSLSRLDEGALVFGRRSRNVARNSATGTWHVTANEALSQTDVEDQRLSLDRWIRRALHEEAGINETQILRCFNFNLFVGLGDMQPGIGCLAFCEGDLDGIASRIVGSQDGTLEYDAYRSLPFNDLDITHAIKRGGLIHSGELVPFSPSADNILRNIVARGTASFIRS